MLWNGPVLELRRGGARLGRLGPDILAQPPDLDAMLGRLRRADQARQVGDALLDQTLVSGIGNMWKAESLWDARLSPWRALGRVSDEEMYRTFNMGVGMVVIVAPGDLHDVEHSLERRGETAFVIGSVEAGAGVILE